MSRSGARLSSRLYGPLLVGLCLALAGCAPAATPTPVPAPTPDPVDIYIRMTESYTSPGVILAIGELSAEDVDQIVRAMMAIEAPAGLEDLHEQAVSGWKWVSDGKWLLPGADGRLRSEAYFMMEWGMGLLIDYRERLSQVEH